MWEQLGSDIASKAVMRKVAFLFTVFFTMGLIGVKAQSSLERNGLIIGEKVSAAKAQEDVERSVKHLEAQRMFIPKDPWRVLNSKTNYAKGEGWKQFCGHVVSVEDGGVVIRGQYGEPMDVSSYSQSTVLFFVANFPLSVAVGDKLLPTSRLVAKEIGIHGEGADAIHGLDYGHPCDPPLQPKPTAEQIAAAKQQADQVKLDAAARTLQFQRDLAAKGDAYGQFKMGLRYATGDGVAADLPKARELLAKAAAQGNKDAAAELAKLPGQ